MAERALLLLELILNWGGQKMEAIKETYGELDLILILIMNETEF
jgi:hypothetical protein